MPTKRTRRTHTRHLVVDPVALHYLADKQSDLFPLPDDADTFVWTLMRRKERRPHWEQHRATILPVWIEHRPGTRPATWWDVDSPEQCRQRLGGIGDVAWQHLATAPGYLYGLPRYWIDQQSVDYYNGRTLGSEPRDHWTKNYHEGYFKGKAIDPKNPPLYESQAAFLKRHDLLTPTEKRILKPRDFEPEAVTNAD